jgi:hypothetical protein
MSISAALPPMAPTGMPPPTAFPKIVKSGDTPAKKASLFFECFPYLYPEPVLVK